MLSYDAEGHGFKSLFRQPVTGKLLTPCDSKCVLFSSQGRIREERKGMGAAIKYCAKAYILTMACNHRYPFATIYVSNKSWGMTVSVDLVQTALGVHFWSFMFKYLLLVKTDFDFVLYSMISFISFRILIYAVGL